MSDSSLKQYFVRSPRGATHGPYTAQSLARYIEEGRIASPWMVKQGPSGAWMEVSDALREMRASGRQVEPKALQTQSNDRTPSEATDKVARSRDGLSPSDWFTRWSERHTVWTLRRYATIAAFSALGLAILLGPILGFSRDAVLPIAFLFVLLLILRGILNLACMADPDSDWNRRMREDNKPWKPRVAPSSEPLFNEKAGVSQDSLPTENPSMASATTQTETESYYQSGDAAWDIIRGVVALVISVVAWLFWWKDFGANWRPGTLSFLILFALPIAGIFYLGRGIVFLVREWWHDTRANR